MKSKIDIKDKDKLNQELLKKERVLREKIRLLKQDNLSFRKRLSTLNYENDKEEIERLNNMINNNLEYIKSLEARANNFKNMQKRNG